MQTLTTRDVQLQSTTQEAQLQSDRAPHRAIASYASSPAGRSPLASQLKKTRPVAASTVGDVSDAHARELVHTTAPLLESTARATAATLASSTCASGCGVENSFINTLVICPSTNFRLAHQHTNCACTAGFQTSAWKWRRPCRHGQGSNVYTYTIYMHTEVDSKYRSSHA